MYVISKLAGKREQRIQKKTIWYRHYAFPDIL